MDIALKQSFASEIDSKINNAISFLNYQNGKIFCQMHLKICRIIPCGLYWRTEQK